MHKKFTDGEGNQFLVPEEDIGLVIDGEEGVIMFVGADPTQVQGTFEEIERIVMG
jgi:hypothetical protein